MLWMNNISANATITSHDQYDHGNSITKTKNRSLRTQTQAKVTATTIGLSVAGGAINHFVQKYLKKLDRLSITKASVPQEPLEQEDEKALKKEEEALPSLDTLEQGEEDILQEEEEALPSLDSLEQEDEKKSLQEEEALPPQDTLEQGEQEALPSLDSLEQEESTPAVEGFTSSNSEE